MLIREAVFVYKCKHNINTIVLQYQQQKLIFLFTFHRLDDQLMFVLGFWRKGDKFNQH